MTASADYNVVAIENFVPPKQWVPGETVKKEEAVTNTGSIDAFVKQTVSGVLTVSVEVPTTIAPDKAGDSVKDDYLVLDTQAKWGSLEAGSYLAWCPANSANKSKLGNIIDYGITGEADDFDPDVNGLYIFRRAITVKDGTNPAEDEKYDYVGYYYDKAADTYYKLYDFKVDDETVGENGVLTAAPTDIFYSKKITKTLNKTTMKYEDASSNGPRLTVEYNAENSVETSALANTDRVKYEAYRAYMDALVGKTKWADAAVAAPSAVAEPDPTAYSGGVDDEEYKAAKAAYDTYCEKLFAATYNAADKDNKTGLTTYDQFDVDGTGDDEVKDDLTNWSQRRLEDMYTDAVTVVTTKTVTPWADLYDKAGASASDLHTGAKPERVTVDKGYNATKELARLKSEVEALIGSNGDAVLASTTDTTADTFGAGLYLKATTNNGTSAADKYTWGAKGFDVDPDHSGNSVVYADATATLTTPTGNATLANWDNDTKQKTMTPDSLDESRFADKDYATTDNGDNQFGSKVTFQEIYTPFTDTVTDASTLKQKWDKLVLLNEKKALLQKKIDLTTAAVTAGVTTNIGRHDDPANAVEPSVYLSMLNNQMSALQTEIATAETEYKAASDEVSTKIKRMNELQALVDAANVVYNAQYADSYTPAGDKHTKPTTKAEVTTVPYYDNDTPAEVTLREQLIDVYGIALREADKDDYKFKTDDDDHNGVETNYKTTYSNDATKNAIDNALTSTDGVIQWKTSDANTLTPAQMDAVDGTSATDIVRKNGSPYYVQEKTNFMKVYRTQEVADLLAAYNAIDGDNAAAGDLDAAEAALGGRTLKLYINLDAIGNGGEAQKWQPVGVDNGTNIVALTNGATGTDFIFGYTNVLESGETSAKLIKSVTFDENVTQDAFLDMVFDINIGVESAQVVYNGDKVQCTAADSSMNGAQPDIAGHELANVDVPFSWATKTAAGVKDTRDGKDPNPTVTANVPDEAGTKYTVKIDGTDTTVTKVDPVTIAGQSYRYKIVDGDDVYYGQSTESRTVFTKVADPAAETLTFADPAVTKTLD